MIPPPAPAPPLGGARMLRDSKHSSESSAGVAFVTAARWMKFWNRREAQVVG